MADCLHCKHIEKNMQEFLDVAKLHRQIDGRIATALNVNTFRSCLDALLLIRNDIQEFVDVH